ncbi:hypothetical protein PV396_41955 [Streptomyces sp. ME02-8801-2C]|uniref:hypothetical protein n=1 Tax=Streptomyces sp. ME02-8801-2C TaxID=3028680 RepID=UPI0029B26393|nr:hypothetical protein [Streptomyces sp. ME02-8801-2C]MDX3458430.1 hypothetical protein [Streptomyces sp. ME02-8801-2C]
MTKTVTIQEAEQQLTAATATLDQLKAKILDHGPGSVTAEELGTAALAVEHASLTIGHAVKTAETSIEAERQERLQLLKAQILEQAGDVDTALDAMRQIETAAAALIEACAGRQTLIGQATAAMRRDGVPQSSEASDEHAGLGWADAGMGRSDAVYVDGRKIGYVSAGVIIAGALDRASRQAGRSVRHLQPAIDVPVHQDIAQDPEAWLTARY